MAQLPDDKIQQIIKKHRQGIPLKQIAREEGVDRNTVRRHVRKLSPTSYEPGTRPPTSPQILNKLELDNSIEVFTYEKPPSDEEMMRICGIDRKKWIPKTFRGNLWQGFYKVKDGEGHKKVNLVQSRVTCERIITEQLEDAILEFVKDTVKPLPRPRGRAKKLAERPQMVTWGLWDTHVGMYAWNKEVGEDYDIGIAVNRVLNAIDDIAEELTRYPVGKILMPMGNDYMHYDSARQTTTHGTHPLDTDSRFAKGYYAGLKGLAYLIDKGLEIASEIEVMYVPGNHDLSTSYTLCVALQQRYRNDPRVKFDLSMSPRKYRLNGGVLIGFDHGQLPIDRYPTVLGVEAHEHWSASTYREVQIGHTHKKKEKHFFGNVSTVGCTVAVNPAMTATDAWHNSKGFIDPQKAVEARRFDKHTIRGTHFAYARDDERGKFEI